MEQFPGNSHNEKSAPEEKKEPKKVKQVVKGRVVRQKQPLSKRLREHFLPTGDVPLGEHILFEVLLPGAKAAASEVFHQSIDIILPVESRRGVPRRGGGTFTHYRGASSSRRSAPWDREDPRENVVSRRARATHAFDQVVFDDRIDAEEALDELYNTLAQYDVVTVGDFYDAVGASKEFTDENYGWTALGGIRIIRRGGGYIIDLPPTEPLTRNR